MAIVDEYQDVKSDLEEANRLSKDELEILRTRRAVAVALEHGSAGQALSGGAGQQAGGSGLTGVGAGTPFPPNYVARSDLRREATQAAKNNPGNVEGSNGPLDQPQFQPGMIFTEDCLAIDRYGVAWWVRPKAMKYIRAHQT